MQSMTGKQLTLAMDAVVVAVVVAADDERRKTAPVICSPLAYAEWQQTERGADDGA